jgi:hypothetical protein
MSFDLFLQRFQLGDPAEVDKAGVIAVLRKYSQAQVDRFGFYLVVFPDGSDVEFSAQNLEYEESFTGCAFHIRGFSPPVVDFVYEIARSGDMVILNVQGRDDEDSPLAILTAASQGQHMPSDWPVTSVLCRSAEHLSELLGVGYADWEDFRNRVIGD